MKVLFTDSNVMTPSESLSERRFIHIVTVKESIWEHPITLDLLWPFILKAERNSVWQTILYSFMSILFSVYMFSPNQVESQPSRKKSSFVFCHLKYYTIVLLCPTIVIPFKLLSKNMLHHKHNVCVLTLFIEFIREKMSTEWVRMNGSDFLESTQGNLLSMNTVIMV